MKTCFHGQWSDMLCEKCKVQNNIHNGHLPSGIQNSSLKLNTLDEILLIFTSLVYTIYAYYLLYIIYLYYIFTMDELIFLGWFIHAEPLDKRLQIAKQLKVIIVSLVKIQWILYNDNYINMIIITITISHSVKSKWPSGIVLLCWMCRH